MNLLIYAAGGGVALLLLISLLYRSQRGLKSKFYERRWQEIEEMSKNEASWVQVIIDSDKLLDEALKQSRYNGKTVAERMVSANRAFSDADGIWRAHKLRNKVVHENGVKLRQKNIDAALSKYRQALKDLGAL